MAKHAVPKQKQSKGRSSRRYKTFVGKARKKLLGVVQSNQNSAAKAEKLAKAQKKASTKVTTIKAD